MNAITFGCALRRARICPLTRCRVEIEKQNKLLKQITRVRIMTFPSPSRRDFLRAASAAGAATLLGGGLRAKQPERPTPTADAMILLWMAGGMSHCETWAPKRYATYEP